MNTITAQKPFEEIEEALKNSERIYIVGCGTCATICHTGGKSEVVAMKTKLEEIGKTITGWMVIPTACDDMTKEALETEGNRINQADGILVMTCAFGVQTVAHYTEKAVYPSLNTLFIGKEEAPARFAEMCVQCGECLLGRTAAICPMTACSKGLLNGPCGGYRHGMCEVDPNRECAWIQIYQRLKKVGQLEWLTIPQPPKDYSKMAHPRRSTIEIS